MVILLIMCYLNPWQTSDLTSLYPRDIAHRNTVNFKVHTFMDVNQVRQIPPGILAVRRGAPAFSHRNSGQLIMVGALPFPKKTAELIFRLAHYDRAKFFDTEDDGW